MMQDALTNEARRALRSGDTPGARRLIRNALEADSTNAEAWALSSLLTSQPEEQLRVLEHALKLDPQQPLARQALEHVRQKLAAAPTPVTAIKALERPLHTSSTGALEAAPPPPELPIIDSRRRQRIWPVVMMGIGLGALIAAAVIWWLGTLS